MKAVAVAENVYWVGAIDWELREFHGYTTERGTTYNAYLVLSDPPVLIDTVKAPFLDEMLARISTVCDPARIGCVISNHSEMDHSGALPALLSKISPKSVLASANGVKALTAHFGPLPNLQAVKDGESLTLGGKSFTFFETRMLHWPDSMVTWLPESHVLFSQDAFGMHLATRERFDDELDASVLEYEARKYFANILMPYAGIIPRALDKLAGIPAAIIAPDHGPIWRESLGRVFEWYRAWSEQKPQNRAVIVYDTMWGSTARMAAAVKEGLEANGTRAHLLPLSENNRSRIATEVLCSGALITGSPTINNRVFPTLCDIMSYLHGLRPKNLIGAAFGSYGWSGESVKELNALLDAMKVERVSDGVSSLYAPTAEILDQCRAMGAQLAEKLRERC